MIILGVIRIRAAQRRTQQEDMADAEMAWDDSALNITVNPMEVCMNVRIESNGSLCLSKIELMMCRKRHTKLVSWC